MDIQYSLYSILEISSDASVEEIRSAFKRRALAVHPDKGGTKEAFQNVLLAFETLADVGQRQLHDRALSRQSSGHCNASRRTSTRVGVISKPQSIKTESRSSGSKDNHVKWLSRGGPSRSKVSLPEQGVDKQRFFDEPTKLHQISKDEHYPKRIFKLMQLLPLSRRRDFLQCHFSQPQRKKLEEHMLAKQAGGNSSQHYVLSTLAPTAVAVRLADSNESCESRCGSDSSSELFANGADTCCFLALSEGNVAADEVGTQFIGACTHSDADNESDGDKGEKKGTKRSQVACKRKRSAHGLFVSMSGRRYIAKIVFDGVLARTKSSLELSDALDAAMFLTTFKQRSLQGPLGGSDDSIRNGLQAALVEHSLSAEAIGLRFNLNFSKAFWIGRHILQTPLTTDLEELLRARTRLRPFQNRRGYRGQVMIMRTGLEDLLAQWRGFCREYIEVCTAAGECKQSLSSRLAALELAHQPVRESRIEWWNRKRMEAEERFQLHCMLLEQRQLRRDRVRMRREDRQSRCWQRPLQSKQARIERGLRTLLNRWNNHLTKTARRQAIEQKIAAKGRIAEKLAAEKQTKEAARFQKTLREKRWKAMNRPGLTMDEIRKRCWMDIGA